MWVALWMLETDLGPFKNRCFQLLSCCLSPGISYLMVVRRMVWKTSLALSLTLWLLCPDQLLSESPLATVDAWGMSRDGVEPSLLSCYLCALFTPQSKVHGVQKKAYRVLEEVCASSQGPANRFVQSHLDDLKKTLLDSLQSTASPAKRVRAPGLPALTGGRVPAGRPGGVALTDPNVAFLPTAPIEVPHTHCEKVVS